LLKRSNQYLVTLYFTFVFNRLVLSGLIGHFGPDVMLHVVEDEESEKDSVNFQPILVVKAIRSNLILVILK